MQPLARRPRSRAALQLERGEGARTIVIALAANLVIAIAKLIAGLVSRSTAMLAESAHSFADTINEVLLAFAIRRSRNPPDATHPLGHGREHFLWALMAAITSFVIGGCFSVAIAIYELIRGGERGNPLAAWIVLAVSFCADGFSWIQSMRQARNDAAVRGHGLWRHLRHSSDPTVRAVVVEDSAALIGLVLAAAGLLIETITGSTAADSIASLLIGVLLAITAFGLARPLADFLVGRSLPPEYLEQVRSIVASSPAVREVLALQAVYIAPMEVIVAAKIRPAKGLDAEALAAAMDALDTALRKGSDYVADVYLDVTTRASDENESRS